MKHSFATVFTIILVLVTGTAIVAGTLRAKSGETNTAATEAAGEAVPEVAADPISDPTPEPTDEPEAEVFPEATPKPTPEPTPEPEPVPLEKYNDVLEINPYVSGWLSIPDSAINDPVVYTPGSQNYFLHRDVDGTPLEKGTFFIAVNWYEGTNHTLIYGHNMKDGSGFGSLAKFADASYGMSHPVIEFDTLYEDRQYELLATFYSQIDEEELETEGARENADKRIAEKSIAKKQEEGVTLSEEELTVKDLDLHRNLGNADIYRVEKDEDNGRFRYYYFTDLSEKEDFDYYVDNVMERALYDTGATAKWGDELLTLSTCSYHVKNGRFIVVAVRHHDTDNTEDQGG